MSAALQDEVVCVDVVELLTDYLEGALSPQLRVLVDDHLTACSACRLYLEQLSRTIAELGHVPAQTLTPGAKATLMDASAT